MAPGGGPELRGGADCGSVSRTATGRVRVAAIAHCPSSPRSWPGGDASQDAWQPLGSRAARGLFDDLAARRSQPLTPDERRRREELVGRLNRLDNQIGALAGAKDLADDQLKRLDELKDHRLELQGRLAELEAELVQKYQVAAGAVYALDRIQAQLPADAALVGWLDLKTSPKAADPRGDHWACVVRRRGAPRWVRIDGHRAGPGVDHGRRPAARPGPANS